MTKTRDPEQEVSGQVTFPRFSRDTLADSYLLERSERCLGTRVD